MSFNWFENTETRPDEDVKSTASQLAALASGMLLSAITVAFLSSCGGADTPNGEDQTIGASSSGTSGGDDDAVMSGGDDDAVTSGGDDDAGTSGGDADDADDSSDATPAGEGFGEDDEAAATEGLDPLLSGTDLLLADDTDFERIGSDANDVSAESADGSAGIQGLGMRRSGLAAADIVRDEGSPSDVSGGSLTSSNLGPVEGELYTYYDGDEQRQVWLQSDLTVSSDGVVASRESGSGGEVAAKSGQDQPVFRNQAGAFMTLPGGVLVLFDDEWTSEQIQAFFASNGISMDMVTEQQALTNLFLVAADPGFASLNLANALAGQDGVLVSSPDWMQEVATR